MTNTAKIGFSDKNPKKTPRVLGNLKNNERRGERIRRNESNGKQRRIHQIKEADGSKVLED